MCCCVPTEQWSGWVNGKSTLPGELSHPSTRSVVHWECWPHWVSSHADLRASSTPPGYSICAWQCSTNTNCYCISPRDILGSSQAGSSNAGTGDQAAKGELQSCWTGGHSALSILGYPCAPQSRQVCLVASLPSLCLAPRCYHLCVFSPAPLLQSF